jgi:hypothetical protein
VKAAALMILAAQAVSAPADAFFDVISAFQSVQQGGSRNKATRIIENAGAFPASEDDALSRHWPKAKTGTSEHYRDRTLGPAYKVLSLGAGKSAQFEQIFMAGQRARIMFVPRQGTRFQLSVTDDDGKRQCAAVDRAPCDWTPIWTSRYRIELSNPGHGPALYYVVMQ